MVLTLAASAFAAPPASAAPPAVTLIAPADGSTSSTTAPELSVAVSQPEGQALSVTFEGRAKSAPSPEAEPFTLVAIPDIQNYTSAARAPIIAQQSQWVVDTRASLNTQFVVQLGDLVSSLAWPGHWPLASKGLKVLDDNGVPNAVVAGNHDFNITTGEHAEYDAWFPPSRYQNATWTPSTARYGGYMGQNQFGTDPENRANMNNYSLFTAGGIDWLVLGLEWEAPTGALEWADRVLAAHPDRQVVLFTHSFLTTTGTRRTVAQRPGGTSQEALWQSFVRTHCQVKLVLSGHEHNGDLGEARRSDVNACGQQVPQILSDYQSRANGGNGWLRYYRFDPSAGNVTAGTYSPYLNAYETDADSAFTFPFSFPTQSPAEFAPIATVDAVAGSASTTWAGLELDTAYEWRAVASDGQSSTTSATWTVRTPLQSGVVARDGFERSVSSGWGSADVGGPWSVAGSASAFKVAGGAGVVTLTSSTGQQTNLGEVSSSNVRVSATFSVDKVAEAHYVSVIGRRVGSDQYLLRVRIGADGSVRLHVMRNDTAIGAGVEVPGLRMVAGASYQVVFEVTGASPTTLSGKIWRASEPEPGQWQLTRTDSAAALQRPGSVGLSTRVPSAAGAYPLVTSFSELDTTDPTQGGPPANLRPIATFTSTVTGMSVDVDGSRSSDPDGSIVSYAWSFGDGGAQTGPVASHAYDAAGVYPVTLTVTDDDGATATQAASVEVSPPPDPGVVARDGFERSVSSGWGSADVGGPWSLAGSPSAFAVAGGAGVMTSTSSTGPQAFLAEVSSSNARVSATFSVDKVAEAHYVSVIGRRIGTDQYLLRVRIGADGSVRLHAMRNDTAIGAGIEVPGVRMVAGASYRIVFEATGASPTTLSGKIWPISETEPGQWQLTRTDSTAALQRPGSVGLSTRVPSGAGAYPLATSFSEFDVTDPTGP